MSCIITLSGRGSVRSSEENQTGRKLQSEGSDTKHTHTHTHTHLPSHKQLHAHAHNQSSTHAPADILSLFQSFFGCHFLGLLSLHELFTPPLSLTVSNTDLMGRERGRGREREGETERRREREREKEGEEEREWERETERERERVQSGR